MAYVRERDVEDVHNEYDYALNDIYVHVDLCNYEGISNSYNVHDSTLAQIRIQVVELACMV